jgi:uncharacterized damage-inducible protein DinB
MKKEIISQYKASLNMLMDTIKKCPDSLWENNDYGNTYWRIVYHTLFYTSLYLSRSNAQFTPWEKHKVNYNFLGTVTHDNQQIIIDNTYSKNEMTEYLVSIFNKCENSVNDTLPDEKSGFEWLPMSKIETHLYNIRHIQHHAGQLIERLRQKGVTEIKWERKS